MRFLIVDHDPRLLVVLKKFLEPNHVLEAATTAREAITLTCKKRYDAIILDILLPDLSGIMLCQYLRSHAIKSPILVLSDVNRVDQKVRALDSGADDYVTKPFSAQELLARLTALLRRPPVIASNTLELCSLQVDLNSRVVTRCGVSIHLRKMEFELLVLLIQNKNRVVTREMIIHSIQSSSKRISSNTVEVHIKYLRDAIDRPFSPKLVHTVMGRGYILRDTQS